MKKQKIFIISSIDSASFGVSFFFLDFALKEDNLSWKDSLSGRLD